MKRNLFLWAAFAVVMALAGCTQKEIVYVEKEDGTSNGVQLEGNVLKIALSNSLTRAARPIFDSKAANNINRIGVKFYEYGTENELNVTIEANDGYTVADNTINLNNYPATNSTISVKLNMDNAKSKYVNIIVYGYNCGDDVNIFPYSIEKFDQDVSDVLKCEDVTAVQEIFAGCKSNVYVNLYGMFKESPEITLERQVAGLLAYMKNVPAKINVNGAQKDVKKITIRTPKKITGFIMPAKGIMKDTSTTNGRVDDDNNNIANGIKEVDESKRDIAVDLLTFDLSKCTNINKDNCYVFNEIEGITGKVLFANGMNPTEFTGKHFTDNTLFGSCFILPFDQFGYYPDGNDQPTALTINYWGDNDELLKTLYLLMNSGSAPTKRYAIWCNHFYSIGTKFGDSTEDSDGDGNPDKGDDDENPSDEDEPFDISDPSGTQIGLLKVDDKWEEEISLIRPTN